MEKEFVVYQSKSKQIGLSFLGMLMVLASFFILIVGIVETMYLFYGNRYNGFLIFRSL